MATDRPAAYGDTFAEVYDSWYGSISDAEATASLVAELAAGRRVVELGVGTGRLAMPMVRCGLEVVGVDASVSMLGRCRAKPGAAAVALVCADMAALPLRPAAFGLGVVGFNTFFNLITEEAQARCLRDAARAIETGGGLLVEAVVPGPDPIEPEYGESARSDGAGGRILTTSVRDPRDQTVRGVHVHTPARGPTKRLPWAIRYLHTDQLDDVCRRAGFELVDRWRSWDREPFDDDAAVHVSHYLRR